MWIVPWKPFLMKKLLKKEVYRSHEQCMDPLVWHKAIENWKHTSKKKKREMLDVEAQTPIQTHTKYLFGYTFLHPRLRILLLFFGTRFKSKSHCYGYCSWTVAVIFDFSAHQWVPCTVYGTHKSHFSATFSLKMDSTVLFTHLKIILLQYFQFLVLAK